MMAGKSKSAQANSLAKVSQEAIDKPDFLRAAQARRLIFIYKKFLDGKTLSVSSIHQNVLDEIEPVSLRTIQRDFNLLQECTNELEIDKVGKEPLWRMSSEFRKPSSFVDLKSDEILSLHILKAHLKTFKGTMIAEDAKTLISKIDQFAPSQVFSADSLYWDQNNGSYDYLQCDYLLKRTIKYISSSQWLTVSYENQSSGTTKSYTAKLKCLFQFKGSIYAVAYIPKHNDFISLAVQNISELTAKDDYRPEHKEPDFNFKEWSKQRFGVFAGTIVHVELLIKKEFKHYFLNREWHSTQKSSIDKDGNMILQMDVPTSLDLQSWILSWSDAIIVQKPLSLKVSIQERLKAALENYK